MTLEWGACVFPHRWIFLLQQISQRLPSSVLSFRPTSEPLGLHFAQFILLDNGVHSIVCKGEQKKNAKHYSTVSWKSNVDSRFSILS